MVSPGGKGLPEQELKQEQDLINSMHHREERSCRSRSWSRSRT